MEHCSEKSIDSYINNNKRFISIETKIYFLYQISIGIRFLKEFNIVHADLKPQNVLLKIMTDRDRQYSTFLLRLIDFGESYFPESKSKNKL